ncbi:DHA2 family efflux MFS transporter permease subunit [Actinomadura spongiicola]|uniref:DHA2 family efflux MFS transporter permease subunit n=1 Tax=Actinomadura spongiicola TaxID=2303421 RepID=A0A372G7L2_9ACTN|nr:MFS transporter [Actinomadura spongiicola]RFS81297.1 DHA2 family efflux MFS transporter permease subunit [Actinomadura spongiicola]
MTTETTVAERGTSERLGLVLAVCCAGQFLVVLDASVMNVALPSIRTALHFQTGSLQWIINAYTIVFAGFLLLGGRLADIYGRRRVFVGGIGVFTLASLAGGLAWNPASLLVARGVQGLGAAIMAPATLTVLGTTFTDRERRARAFGLWGAVAAGGGAIGALVGGAITEWLSWRWILLVNVPVGILLTAGALYAVTESRKDDDDRRMDLPGALAITAGLILLVYGIVRSEKEGWSSPQIIVSLGLAVVLLTLFAVNEARRDSHPLVPLGIFRNRSVTAANLVAFTSTAALWGTFFLFTLLLQLVLGYSPLETGFAYLPLSLGIVVAARGIAPLVPKIGPRPLLVAGLLLSAAGLAWLSRAGADADFLTDLFGPTLVLGIGQGLVSASMTVAGTSEVGYREQGLVSGLLNTSRQVGGALGLGVLAVVAAAHTSAVAHGGDVTEGALAAGFDRALLVSALFPLLGVAAALAVPKVRPAQERDARG